MVVIIQSKKKMRKSNRPTYQDGQQWLFELESNWQAPIELPDLRQHKQIAIDLETCDQGLQQGKGPGWAFNAGFICGFSVARPGQAQYFPLAHPDTQCFDQAAVQRWFNDHIKAGVKLIFHNAGYDLGWLHQQLQIPVTGNIADTGCMAYMLDENRLNYGLGHLCKWRGIPGKDETKLREAADYYGVQPKNELYKIPARYVGGYAEQDAMSTLLLAESLVPEIIAENVQAAYDLEIELIPMCHAMRKRGLRIDQDAALRAKRKFKQQSADAMWELSQKLEEHVDIDKVRSNNWLQDVFTKCNIVYPRTLKTGKGSFEAKWMKNYPHWLPRLLVQAKAYEEAAEKFIQTYLLDFAHNGRLHASINQFRHESLYKDEGRGGGTRTYRFSYEDPPLQQIPHRNEEMAREIRGCFIAEEGEEWLSADYSQQEYRLIVHYAVASGLPKAAEAAQQYANDPTTDFHQWVADMTGLARKPAKDANFAKSYGAGIAKFATMIGKSQDEAKKIMNQYDEQLPFVKELYERCQQTAENRGYIILFDGARCRFNMWVGSWREHGRNWTVQNAMADCTWEEAQRRQADPSHPWYKAILRRSRCNKALNSLIQGGAARQTKIAMRDVWRAGFTPLLQVHDELCFSVADRSQGERIGELMRSAVPLRVPMMVDLEYGPTWAG